MRLTRVYIDSLICAGRRHSIDGTAAGHIARVLRLRAGDALTLFDGNGGEYSANIDEIRRNAVWVNVLEHRVTERESPLQLTLAQGVSRGERMDWVVQKATELGVSSIAPILTERSVVRLDAKQSEKKVQHWRAIAVAACEQSGRNRIPSIAAPTGLHEFLARSNGATRLLLCPDATRGVADVTVTNANVTVLIGPEGGLADTEQEAAVTAGFASIRLGPRVLRTETAAVAALTLLQQKFGDL